ncbi:methyltransferase domain-containing protein [Granulicella sp. 5B5]|uniref:class I SAM-dependent methyltransferase n=1 Tax=Granulicella sp. 5B5 TaxID=1617967 RepID=UPI0015F68067|nr:class I SAM-dependent methyltransferase [Granulicella sp. 5B5]QMV19638.1 methyltransferase domain-containing protein [Granulicella sp. 5B5]
MTQPEPNFDHVARIYRWAEYLTLGPLLKRTREHYLNRLTPCRQALILGDGDGRFLAQLLRINKNLSATAVDTSATMLQLLRERCAFAAERLETINASALNIEVADNTDLVVTHFFLDCLTQPEVNSITKHIAAHTHTGSLWLVSDFAIPDNAALRPIARLYIASLYLAFRLLTGLRTQQLPDPQSALTASGFVRIARHERLGGLLYTELWQRR